MKTKLVQGLIMEGYYMTRQEIITKVQILKNKAYLEEIPSRYYEGLFDAVEELRELPTLAGFLGWEEGVEYERGRVVYKVEGPKLSYRIKGNSSWKTSGLRLNELINLRQATKNQPKKKAYRVKDEYSFKCLMAEWEKHGYMWAGWKNPPDRSNPVRDDVVVYIDDNKMLSYSTLDWYYSYELDKYSLIDYHEEPLCYARIKNTNLYFTTEEGKGLNTTLDPTEKKTKTEWAKHCVTGENATFEEVEFR